MRIGIDVRKLRDYGIGTHISNVILPAARQSTAHEFILYSAVTDAHTDEANIRWLPEPSAKYSVGEHISLSRKAARDRIALFHSPHYTMPLLLSCKSIVTVHDLIHFKFPENFAAWKVKAASLLVRRVLAKAALVLTVSNTSRNDILEFFPEAKGKIEVLYNRVSPDWLRPVAEFDLTQLGIASDYVLYIGNFKSHKGIETLLAAYERLKSPPMMVLAGNRGGIAPQVLEKIFQAKHVRLLGFVQGDLLRNLYSKATVFVFPSRYEGFGYPPVEAMCCRTPVLSSDTPALKEVLADAAEYFHCGNAEDLTFKLQLLLDSRDRQEHLSEAGFQRAKFFTSDDSPKRLAAIYDSFSL